jgi:hypothetical protein
MATRAELDALIEEATADAFSEDEQLEGFFTLLEERLELPFETKVLGVKVEVVKVDQDDRGNIFFVCQRNGIRQKILVLDLPLPSPLPDGGAIIEAYKLWAKEE